MDPDAARQRIVAALGAGDWNELNYAVDDLATWLHRGGFPPEEGPVKITAAQKRRLQNEAPGRLSELEALNESLRQRSTTENNPTADVHRMEAGQALERGESQVLKAKDLYKKGKMREAFDAFVVAVALAAIATKETLHSGADAFSERQYLRVEELNGQVAQLRRALQLALPKRKRTR